MRAYQSFSSEETKSLGYKIAKEFLISNPKFLKRKNALVFALTGELGSGKTTFIQGFLRGFGVKRRSASPTFIIFRRFNIENCKLPGLRSRSGCFDGVGKIENLYHVDAYRIKKPKELKTLGFGEILDDPRNVVLIEWAEKIRRILPKGVRWLKFEHCRKENERKISL